MAIGPVQIIVIGFDEPEFRGTVLRELQALRAFGAVRLIDALFVSKDDWGGLIRMEMSDLTEAEKMEFGAVIGGMIGFGAAGLEGAEVGEELGALAASENVFGVSGEELQAFSENLEPGTAAAVLLIEHKWGIGFREAVLDAGGEFRAQGFLTPDALFMVGAELEAVAEAEDAIAEAEETVEMAEAIKAEAARQALDALLTAEMIEEAAMDEAADVVAAALAVEAAALDEEAEVVAEAEAVQEAAVEEAAQAVAEARAIKAAAAADVVRTLVAAEMIEEQAVNDVIDALVAADIIEEEAAEEAAAAVLAAEEVDEEL